MSLSRSLAPFAAIVLALPIVACYPLDGKAERHLVTTESTPTAIDVDSSFLDVEVTLATANEVGIKADVLLKTSGGNETAEREIENVMVNVVREGDRLVVRQGDPNKPRRLSGSSSGSGRIAITLPANVPLVCRTASGDVRVVGDFGAVPLKVSTASGDLTLTSLGVGSLVASTASGDARIEVLRSLEGFTWSSASGDLQFAGGADALEAKAASGDIMIGGLRGPGDLSTASGDIRVVFIDGPALVASSAIELSTASGDIDITMPTKVEPSGTIKSASGNISCETPLKVTKRPGSHSATLTGSGVAMTISTASGDVMIKKAK